MPEVLKPQWFHILLALAEQQRHGYGIQRAVKSQTGGAIVLWPAMLYRSLATLRDRGLIEPTDDATDQRDERCQFYRITPTGRARLTREVERMSEWVDIARRTAADTAPAS